MMQSQHCNLTPNSSYLVSSIDREGLFDEAKYSSCMTGPSKLRFDRSDIPRSAPCAPFFGRRPLVQGFLIKFPSLFRCLLAVFWNSDESKVFLNTIDCVGHNNLLYSVSLVQENNVT